MCSTATIAEIRRELISVALEIASAQRPDNDDVLSLEFVDDDIDLCPICANDLGTITGSCVTCGIVDDVEALDAGRN